MKNRSRLVSAILSTDSYSKLDLQEKRIYAERLAKMTDDELVDEASNIIDKFPDSTPIENHEDSPSQSGGWYWYGLLTPKQANRWDKNFEYNRVSEMSKADYLDTKYYSFSDFLKGSFVWLFSNEGHKYWENICKEVESKGLL